MARVVDNPAGKNPPPPPNAGPSDWMATLQADYTRANYARAFLQALGAPITTNNVALLLAVMQNEGTSAKYNPMASTWASGQAGESNFNGVGVKDYPSVQAAISAQVTQWRRVFPDIVNGLMSDNAASVLGNSEWNSYSGNATGSYQQKLAGNFRTFSGDPNAGGQLIGTSGTGTGVTGNSGGGGGVSDAVYQQYAFLLGDTEGNPSPSSLLQALAAGSISDATFQAEFQATPWWKQHSGSARSWQQLQSTDPASYHQQLTEYSRQIVEQAGQLGVGLDIPTVLKLANQWGMSNWQPQDVTNAILGYSQAGRANGGLAYGEDQIRQAAASYGIKLDDRTAYQYELGIAKNQQTLNGLSANFAQQAEQMYPHLKPQLDQGLTLSQIAAPYINTAASTLEVDPSSVDLSNPKWSRALAFHDGSNIRQMTNYEWTQTLMSDPQYGYKGTQGAAQASTGLQQFLGKTLEGVG